MRDALRAFLSSRLFLRLTSGAVSRGKHLLGSADIVANSLVSIVFAGVNVGDLGVLEEVLVPAGEDLLGIVASCDEVGRG